MLTTTKKFRLIQIITITIILAIFIFFRWYKLESSLLFYNDMGRDYLTLFNWKESGKPPLLGPQTSVLSYNQTAWYFYILYPLFLATKMSALSSTLTATIIGVAIFCYLLWKTRNDRTLFSVVSISFLLLSLQPQVVLQNRFIWNPSFLPFFLLTSLVAVLQLTKRFTREWAAAYWLSVAFAVGFSYSALPLVIVLSCLVLFYNRKNIFAHLLFGLIAAGIVLLPLLAFEVRHDFSLTKLFFTGQTTPQTMIDLPTKSSQLLELLFPSNPWINSLPLALIAIGLILYGIFNKTKQEKNNSQYLLISAGVFILTTALLLVLPVNLEKHYVFPVIVTFVLLVANLPKPVHFVLAAVLSMIWMQPYFIAWHTKPPVRTIAEMQQCYQNFCETHQDNYYVSMESGILVGYHNALEHQFFLKKAGCSILDIEQSQDQAQKMLVINDDGNFTPGKSGYRELSLFGEYSVVEKTSCTDHLSILEITKPDAEASASSVYSPE